MLLICGVKSTDESSLGQHLITKVGLGLFVQLESPTDDKCASLSSPFDLVMTLNATVPGGHTIFTTQL